MNMLEIYWNIRICANGRKKTLLSLPKQQENPWMSVKTVSEKQNRDMDLWPELLETIMSV